jgi:transmembrane sensor
MPACLARNVEMRNGMTTDDQTERLLEEAMDRLLRVQAAPDDPAVRAAVAAWVAADSAHDQAWTQAQKAWRLIGAAPPVHAAHWEKPPARPGGAAPSGKQRPKAGRFGVGIAAAALAASLLLLLVGATDPLLRLRADYATAAAELRTVVLPDGSLAHLAPQSALTIVEMPTRRGVRLLAGEAFFEVLPNPNRPFMVEAADIAVTVLGTAFDVRLDDEAATVGVKSGLVSVRRGGIGGVVDERLSAGQRLTAPRNGGAAVRGAVNPDEVAVWRDGYLFVDNATLAQAVAELERYLPGWVVINDERLARRRVTGVYDLSRPESALHALAQPHGGQVRRIGPYLRILSAP